MDKINLTEPQIAALGAMPFTYRVDDDGEIVRRPEGYVGTVATWRALDKMGLADITVRGNTYTVKSTRAGKKMINQLWPTEAAA